MKKFWVVIGKKIFIWEFNNKHDIDTFEKWANQCDDVTWGEGFEKLEINDLKQSKKDLLIMKLMLEKGCCSKITESDISDCGSMTCQFGDDA